MRKLLFLALTVILLAGVVSVCQAAPTILGPTGLVVMPTAESLGQYDVNIFVNHLKVPDIYVNDGDDFNDSRAVLGVKNDFDDSESFDNKLTNYGANIGLGYGVELGATVSHFNHSTNTMINAKWVALPETKTVPGIAIGGINVGDNHKAITEKFTPYVVASKYFAIPDSSASVGAHVGYVGGYLKKMAFGGDVKLSKDLSVQADYIKDYSKFSIGARYNAYEGLCVEAASVDGNFEIGGSYTFNFK